jgi:hypothetical protein
MVENICLKEDKISADVVPVLLAGELVAVDP